MRRRSSNFKLGGRLSCAERHGTPALAGRLIYATIWSCMFHSSLGQKAPAISQQCWQALGEVTQAIEKEVESSANCDLVSGCLPSRFELSPNTIPKGPLPTSYEARCCRVEALALVIPMRGVRGKCALEP